MAARVNRTWVLTALAVLAAALIAAVVMNGGHGAKTSRPAASPSASAPKTAPTPTAFPSAAFTSAMASCFNNPSSCLGTPSR